MTGKDDVFLEEARLGPRSQVLVDCEEVPNIPRLVRRFREYLLTDLAHAVMLTETDILTGARGPKLLAGLLEIFDADGDGFPWLAQSGSFSSSAVQPGTSASITARSSILADPIA